MTYSLLFPFISAILSSQSNICFPLQNVNRKQLWKQKAACFVEPCIFKQLICRQTHQTQFTTPKRQHENSTRRVVSGCCPFSDQAQRQLWKGNFADSTQAFKMTPERKQNHPSSFRCLAKGWRLPQTTTIFLGKIDVRTSEKACIVICLYKTQFSNTGHQLELNIVRSKTTENYL